MAILRRSCRTVADDVADATDQEADEQSVMKGLETVEMEIGGD